MLLDRFFVIFLIFQVVFCDWCISDSYRICRFSHILPVCMNTVHWSLESMGVKLSIVLLVSQNSNAGCKNGVKVFSDELSFFCLSFCSKKASGRVPHTSEGWFKQNFIQDEINIQHQRVGVLESKMSVSATATQFRVSRQTVCDCIATRCLEMFLTYPTVGSPKWWLSSRIVTSLLYSCGTDFSQQQSPDWEE